MPYKIESLDQPHEHVRNTYHRDFSHCLTDISDLRKCWNVKTSDDEILFDYLKYSYFQYII